MDAMDDETRRRLEEKIVELEAQHEEALKTTFSSQKERRRELNQIKTAIRHKKKQHQESWTHHTTKTRTSPTEAQTRSHEQQKQQQ
jgi:hypothetical protein